MAQPGASRSLSTSRGIRAFRDGKLPVESFSAKPAQDNVTKEEPHTDSPSPLLDLSGTQR